MSNRVPYLHVCVTCRAGRDLPDGETAAGQHLFEAMAALIGADGPVRVKPVSCLANCERGCTAVISQPGKFGYVLGHLSDALAPDLLTYANAYALAKTGAVMPSKRPATLATMLLGRFPPAETL